jgi:exodeoxyribonuclease V
VTEAPHEWTPQQQAALDKARRWLDAPLGSVPQVHRIDGYAGTGKSTLAFELNAHVGNAALAGAFTGKAASVMARKGLPGATTIHRMIYTPGGDDTRQLEALRAELEALEKLEFPGPRDEARRLAVARQLEEVEATPRQPRWLLKEESDVGGAPLVIIDEHSMVDERLGTDLLSFGTRVLALGDPGQLPPVKGTGFFLQGRPDSLLTEVHRQAKDSPIIALATAAREGRYLPRGDFGAARVVDKITAAQAQAADMILTGTNKRRQAINRRHRQLGGHTDHPMPQQGEWLCCLRNNHDLGLLNGTLWRVREPTEWEAGESTVLLHLEGEDGRYLSVSADAALLLDETDRNKWPVGEEFTWGYCLTVHKSQGSAWDRLVLFNDWPSNQSRREWLYTGITRAAEDLTVVQE